MRAALGTWWSRGISAATRTIDSRLPSGLGSEKTLYLTFDDGPTESGTPALLEVLSRFSVPATFFLVGENALRLPHRFEEIVCAGHEIGNHSYSHADAWKVSRRAAIADLRRGGRVLEKMLGAPVRLLRPPFGRVTLAIAHWAIRNRQRLTLWDVMPPDFQPGIAKEPVLRSLVRGVRNGSIICMHDNENSEGITPSVLAEGLPILLEQGWEFALLPSPKAGDRDSTDQAAGS